MTDRQKLLALIRGDKAMVKHLLNLAAEPELGTTVTSDERAAGLFMPLLAGHENERFAVAALDRRHRVVDIEVLTTGSDAFVVVDPKQILRWALTRERSVQSLLVAHNHPSGDPKPSQQDIEVTRRVSQACNAVGMTLLDHLVIGSTTRWTSLRSEGHVPQVAQSAALWASESGDEKPAEGRSRREVEIAWRRARRHSMDMVRLWDIVYEASGLLEYETCGSSVIVRPSSQLFGRTGHTWITIEAEDDVELFLALAQDDGGVQSHGNATTGA